MRSTLNTPEVLARGGWYFEGARWHEGRWWVSDIYAKKVCTYDSTGTRVEVMHVDGNPSGLGWLPDGSLLVVSMHDRTIVRLGSNGETEVHADLSALCRYELNDMVVTRTGHAFVGTIGFDVAGGEDLKSGALYHVDPNGQAARVADLCCPNGMVLTQDERTLIVAESFAGRLTAFTVAADGALSDQRVFAQVGSAPAAGPLPEVMAALQMIPDGCAVDAEDGVWVADGKNQRVLRFDSAGSITAQIEDPDGLGVYACALGGEDGHTLLLCTVPDFFAAATGAQTDQAVLKTVRVETPRAARS